MEGNKIMLQDTKENPKGPLVNNRIGILSVKDFASLTGYSPRTIRNNLSSKKWDFGVRLTDNGRWFIDIEKFKSFTQVRTRKRVRRR